MVIIVSTSEQEAEFWQERLNSTRGTTICRDARLFSLFEDWEGEDGAGNLLGTLYAWKKGIWAARNDGIDLESVLSRGGNVAIYHTAGKGMRLAPLPGCEANSKSAVKLPRMIRAGCENRLLTILEAVILSTGLFASSRGGRLSVWWGDQVFIPSRTRCSKMHHVEIFGKSTRLSAGIKSYGLLLPQPDGTVLQREKMPLPKVRELLQQKGLDRALKSMGSFSITAEFLSALMDEFAADLDERMARLDTDPHLWQPITSSEEEYLDTGGKQELWERVDNFRRRWQKSHENGLIGAMEIGPAWWWDYGQISLYHRNLLKILDDSKEGEAARSFYCVEGEPPWIVDSSIGDVKVERSVLIGCYLSSGEIENSILAGVRAEKIHVENSVLLDTTILGHLRSAFGICYGDLMMEDTEIRNETSATTFHPEFGQLRMRTHIERDGKKDWNVRVGENPLTYRELFSAMKGTSPEAVHRIRKAREEELLHSMVYDRIIKGKEYTVPALANENRLEKDLAEKILENLASLEREVEGPGGGPGSFAGVEKTAGSVYRRLLVDPLIFKTYDVREIVGVYLSDKVCFYLGKGFGTYLRRTLSVGEEALRVVVSGGVRLSTPYLKESYIQGLLSSGIDVLEIAGVLTTPEMNFSIALLEAHGGANVTASHNPPEYNGFKQSKRCSDGLILSITADEMLRLKEIILRADFLHGRGRRQVIPAGLVRHYHGEFVKADVRLGSELMMCAQQESSRRGENLRQFLDRISILEFPEEQNAEMWEKICWNLGLPSVWHQPVTSVRHPLRGVVGCVDFNNGSTIGTLDIYEDLGAEIHVVPGSDIPDGSFPLHNEPNPLRRHVIDKLVEFVRDLWAREKRKNSPREVVGWAFDEDGDRWIAVRADGQIVPGDRILAIQAREITREFKERKVAGKPRFMGEVEFSTAPIRYIRETLGAEFILTKKGFALIKEAMAKIKRSLERGEEEVEIHGTLVDLRQNRQPVYLAAELSGHQMAWEEFFIDDATLAVAKLLRTVILSSVLEGKGLIELDGEIPRYPTSEPELDLFVPHESTGEQKEELVQRILEVFRRRGLSIVEVDGGIIHFSDDRGGWVGKVSTRKSNTQPAIKASLEAISQEWLERIEDDFFGVVSLISTSAIPWIDLRSSSYLRERVLPRLERRKISK